VVQPTESALDHPPAGQQHEFLGLFGTQYHRQIELEAFCHPIHQTTAIATINPNLAQLFTAAGPMA
jgi:hypothetical protein